MKMLFAAVHESGIGTIQTSRSRPAMSVHWGNRSRRLRARNDAIDPKETWSEPLLDHLVSALL